MVLPISISNADLVVAFAVTEDADGTATGAPVKGGTLLVWGFGARLALSAIPLAVLSGEDPCVGHGENGDEGEDSAGRDLHFEWYGRKKFGGRLRSRLICFERLLNQDGWMNE